MEESRFSPSFLKLAILKFIGSRPEHVNRFNMLGSTSPPGGQFEHASGIQFKDDERAVSYRCVRQLEDAGLVEPSFQNLRDKEHWLILSSKGKKAVELNAIDELDRRLYGVNPGLVDTRQGAWSALYTRGSDSSRHAAQSARELLRQVQERYAPESEVRGRPWFKGKKVTQRDQFRLAVEKGTGRVSESTVDLIEAHVALIEKLYARLSKVAKSETAVSISEVERLVRNVEDVLRTMLGADE